MIVGDRVRFESFLVVVLGPDQESSGGPEAFKIVGCNGRHLPKWRDLTEPQDVCSQVVSYT